MTCYQQMESEGHARSIFIHDLSVHVLQCGSLVRRLQKGFQFEIWDTSTFGKL